MRTSVRRPTASQTASTAGQSAWRMPRRERLLLDILRLAGGTTRTYCFHGPGHDGFQSSLTFGEKGHCVEVSGITAVWPTTWSSHRQPPSMAMYGPIGSARETGAPAPHPSRTARRRYITARCAKPDIPPIRYLFAEEEGADGASEFISLWQPYEGEPFIQKVERLTVEGPARLGIRARCPPGDAGRRPGGYSSTPGIRAPFSVPAVWSSEELRLLVREGGRPARPPPGEREQAAPGMRVSPTSLLRSARA